LEEIWKDIKGFEGYYQISNHGRIKSFKRAKNGRVLSVKNGNGWYLTTNLFANGKRVTARIHRLVAEHFIPNPEGKPHINHKDGNKQNNRVNNLEWVTPKENSLHAVKNNPDMIKGMVYYNKYIKPALPKERRKELAKHLKNCNLTTICNPVLQYTLNGKFIAEYPNAKEAEEKTGVCRRNICQVASKEEYKPGKIRKQAGGYKWLKRQVF